MVCMEKYRKKTMTLSIVLIAYSWSGAQRDFFKKFPTVIIENNPNAPKKHVADAEIIFNKKNTGFASAANQGAKCTDSEFLLFLNDDCAITTAQINELITEAQKRKWNAISPTLIGDDGKVQKGYQQPIPSFFSLVIDWTPLHHVFGHVFHSQQKTLPGGCLLIRRETLEKLDGWDERFWLWWEDTDLSYRIAQADVQFGIAENILVEHVGGGSFATLEETWRKGVFFHSLRLFAQKHFSPWQAQIISLVTSRFDASQSYPHERQLL